jgi:hypothetical protein
MMSFQKMSEGQVDGPMSDLKEQLDTSVSDWTPPVVGCSVITIAPLALFAFVTRRSRDQRLCVTRAESSSSSNPINSKGNKKNVGRKKIIGYFHEYKSVSSTFCVLLNNTKK